MIWSELTGLHTDLVWPDFVLDKVWLLGYSDSMQNKDGSFGSRATHRELAAAFGEDCIRQLEYLSEVIEERWEFYVSQVVQSAMIAANHGRRSLKQYGR